MTFHDPRLARDFEQFREEWQLAFRQIERVAGPVAGEQGSVAEAVTHIKRAVELKRTMPEEERDALENAFDALRTEDSRFVWEYFGGLPQQGQDALTAAGFEELFGQPPTT